MRVLEIAQWCNDRTKVFETLSLGLNPDWAATWRRRMNTLNLVLLGVLGFLIGFFVLPNIFRRSKKK